MRLAAAFLLCALAGASACLFHLTPALTPAIDPRFDAVLCSQPLWFEKNVGQTDQGVEFLARGPGYMLFLTPTEAILKLSSAEPRTRKAPDPKSGIRLPRRESEISEGEVARIKLLGTNRPLKISGLDRLPSRRHYLIGKDPSGWRTDVPLYAKVRYTEMYRGIDVLFYGSAGQLEYDFVVAPGADPSQIRLSFQGLEPVGVEEGRDLLLKSGSVELRLLQPKIYQEYGNAQREVAGSFSLGRDRSVSFEIAPYDQERPLIIDPILIYSTYLGGSREDLAHDVAVDAAKNVYVAGDTFSSNFPRVDAVQPTFGGQPFVDTDLFVSKLSPRGEIIYSTYIGGSRDDSMGGIAVDALGNVYVSGWTSSPNFPTAGAIQATRHGPADVVVLKLNNAGTAFVWSTYLGGGGPDGGDDIAIDSAGNSYVIGSTRSTDFPTLNAAQPSYGGGLTDTVVFKINAAGNTLIYSTYLGGSGEEDDGSISVDRSGNAYVAAETDSPDFPTTPGAVQPVYKGGQSDVYIAKLNPSGSSVIFSTYVGGTNRDVIQSVQVDVAGNVYALGSTLSTNFPTAHAFQGTPGGGGGAFVLKLNPSGSAFNFSTYLGGVASEVGYGLAIDTAGNIYVSGSTHSGNFPVINPIQAALAGSESDLFISKFNPTANTLLFSTFFGGPRHDGGARVAIDLAGGYLRGRAKLRWRGIPYNECCTAEFWRRNCRCSRV